MTARPRPFFTCLVLCALLATSQPASLSATAARAGDDPRFVIEKITDNLELPVGFDFAPDGRIFILEKAGRIKIWKDGVLYARPLLDIRDEVNEFVDRGLLGIAVDPQFVRNGYIYLSYVYDPPGAVKDNEEPRMGRIVRYTVSGDVARPNSAQIILDDFTSDTQQHSVGSLRFAPDGALFASFGDGALSQGVQALSLRAQKLDNIQGKLLRIDTNGNGLKGNPFFDEKNPRSARSRIWAYGFRNPFRFSVHPQTGVPYVGDVGWNTYEWLMRATPGANFGWPCVEGSDNSPDYQSKPECTGVTAASTARKEIVYPHAGAPASITGGGFNLGAHFPDDTQGDLFFADYSKYFVRRAKLDSQGSVTGVFDVIGNIGEPVDLQFGRDGALYVMSYQSRGFMRIRVKDRPLGSLTVAGSSTAAPLPISGAGDGDTLLPGTRLTLKTAATDAYWQITAHAGRGRASQNLARGDGSSIVFEMPKTLGDDGYVEVLLAAPGKSGMIDSARLALYAPHSDGYIRSWWLAGSTPWYDLNMDGLGNESSFAPKPDDKRAWLIRSPTRHVDLRRYVTPSPGVFGVLADKAITYAFVWIDVPEDRAGLLGMNSDDGLAAWLNGREIWRNKVGRTMPNDLRDIDLPPITLKKGRNALLIKVDTYGGDWQFKARVLNPDGSIMRDVQVRTAP
jgi:glucose/arabinose dehydrogenase